MWLKAGDFQRAKRELERVVRVYDKHAGKLGLQVGTWKAALATACEGVGEKSRAKQLHDEVRGIG